MTAQEYKDKVLKAAQSLREENIPFKLATYSTVAAQAKRIFTDGQNTNGQQFQYNSTKPLYVDPLTSFNGAKLGQPIGKTGKKIFESGAKKGQPHKTVYLESYKDYRKKIGRDSPFVNWELSGDLKLDFENPQMKGGDALPIKVSNNEYLTGLKRDDSIVKRRVLEQKYGSIFYLSDLEKAEFYKDVSFELRKLLADD